MRSSVQETKKKIRSVLTYFPFRVQAERASSRISGASIEGLTLTIPPGVFHPQFFLSSRILMKEIGRCDLEGKRVLDMGTGSGILAIAAARRGAEVLAVDINPDAVRAAHFNAWDNGLSDHVSVIRSDLFKSVPKQEFDFIIWNPPFFPNEPTNMERAAWDAGKGYNVLERFAVDAHDYLLPRGECLVIFSSDMDIPKLVTMFEMNRLNAAIRGTHRRFLETFHVYTFSRINQE